MSSISSSSSSSVALTDLSELLALREAGSPTLILFWAAWHDISRPGGQYHSIFCSLQEALSLTKVTFKTAEAEAVPEVSESLQVGVVPTVVAFRGVEIVGKLEGANPNDLKKLAIKLENLAKMTLPTMALESQRATGAISSSNSSIAATTTTTPSSVTAESNSVPIEERCRRVVNKSPVMLFMKGNPDAPRCGFSRQIVEILRTHDISFGHFDILLDEDIRQGLKTYSDWPTYPQLYVLGTLAGGLDILKEMVAAGGSLKEQLGIPADDTVFKVESLEDKLRRLISQAPIVLFMKGSPDAPRCGFSRQICELLNGDSISYAYFDILTDIDVREGLKTFSDWPSYPQLYVKGTLVGGLDIVKEMKAGGPLKDQLV